MAVRTCRLNSVVSVLSVVSADMLMVLLTGTAAQAALPDPTRPPPGVALSVPVTTALPRPALPGPAQGLAVPVPPPAPTPRVQALQRPSEGQSGSASALIDGRLVRTGDRVGDATVQEIRPDGVWLRLSRGGTQWLGLFAPVEAPAAEASTGTAKANTPGQSAPRKEP